METNVQKFVPKYDRPVPALLLTDFYKICHRSLFNPDTRQLVSYWTPRKSRLDYLDYTVMFWLQATVKKYLVDHFNVTFFARSWEEVRAEYVEYVAATFYQDIAEGEIEAFKKVYDLGYLPVEIRAVPEGTRVPIGVPCMEIRATEDFAFWLPQYLETLLSCNLWPAMTAAAIADANRRELESWYVRTVEDGADVASGAGNFSMRGMMGCDAAVMVDAGHLLSFRSTATVPTAWALKCFYNADFNVARGVPSTEHSIPESWGKDRELDYYRHVLKERPYGPLSIVSDTWDLEHVVTEFLPVLKPDIMARDGKVVIRPDSGDPADIICGVQADAHPERVTGGPLDRGCIELLWDVFGGTVNSKGYKILDKHIGLIYGDAITHDRLREICSRLEAKGFAANNVIFGFGSFTYQYVTRDSLGFALKVTHGVIGDTEKFMFKDPKTDRGAHSAGKKSQRGMCVVYHGEDGKLMYDDGHTMTEADAPGNLLRPMFRNGELLIDDSFDDIRNRLHPEGF